MVVYDTDMTKVSIIYITANNTTMTKTENTIMQEIVSICNQVATGTLPEKLSVHKATRVQQLINRGALKRVPQYTTHCGSQIKKGSRIMLTDKGARFAKAII